MKRKFTITGTASDELSLASVSYQVKSGRTLGPIRPATGTTNWSARATLKKGKNKILVFAKDTAGNQSLIKTLKVNSTGAR
ncbi:MAG: hypothetical protein HC845_08545 [Akkermansiaceae bacterium]|nr:hypothetical protein [Akkermansiaceae bacterium]